MPFCFFNAFYTAFRRFFSLLFFLLFLIFLINFYFPHFCRSISLIRFVSLNASAFHPYVLFFYFLYIIPFLNLNSFLHFFCQGCKLIIYYFKSVSPFFRGLLLKHIDNYFLYYFCPVAYVLTFTCRLFASR